MINIFKNFRPYMRTISIIFILLLVQAYCTLSLPQYTSDIIDIGIQNKGQEHILPQKIVSEDFQTAQLFMSEEEKEIWKSVYTKTDDEKIYELKAENEELDELDEKLLMPMVINYRFELLKAKEKEQTASMTEDANINFRREIEIAREKTKSTIDKIGDKTVKSMGAAFAVSLEKRAGVDIDKKQKAYLWAAGIRMTAFSALMLAVAVMVSYLAAKVGAGIGRDLRRKIYRNVMGFSNAEMDRFSTASLITRSTNDVQQIQQVSVMMLRMALFAPIMGLGGIYKVTQTGAKMGWVIALAVGVIMVIIGLLIVIAMPKFKKMQTLIDNMNLVSREILTGLPVIRAFGRESEEESRFDDANRRLQKNQLFTNRVMTFMLPTMMLIMYSLVIGITWVGANRIDAGSLRVGAMTAFISYAIQIVMAFVMLTVMSIILPRAGVSADRIEEVIKSDSSITNPENTLDFPCHRKGGTIEFKNVSFKFPGAEKNVLEDISFILEPGTVTALIGSTGSGKSTIVNLIPRFYDVTEGSIEFNGIDLRNLDLKQLRDQIGLVPQKGILFSGNIAENIRFGNHNADMDELEAAAEIAQAMEFIEDKEDGFDFNISQGGSNVSGGQKQRLAIARAIAKEPSVYIFDDSFSALDMKTDAKLRKALSEKTKDASVLIVAQRISTIINADTIIVLDDGKIVSRGKHDELMKNCDVYAQIANSQLSKKELGIEEA
ncbi:MAG: ABC transporter ATP-binding protein [Eubacterium sp.]|nr:ABC transporter ATP-binding protein [Eubacterium sp.]